MLFHVTSSLPSKSNIYSDEPYIISSFMAVCLLINDFKKVLSSFSLNIFSYGLPVWLWERNNHLTSYNPLPQTFYRCNPWLDLQLVFFLPMEKNFP